MIAIFLSMSSCIAVVFILLLWRILQRVAFIPLNREISNRKEAEQQLVASNQQLIATSETLRKSEENFRALVESSSDWIWETNAEGVYIYVSSQIEGILGYKPEEIIGKSPFSLMPPEEASRITFFFEELLGSGKPIVALENINLHKDGRCVVLETSGIPVFDNAGNICGYRGMDRDITERKLAEEQRETLVKKLEYKNTELQDIVYTASHDLRSPLVNIEGFSGELESDCVRLAELLVKQTDGEVKSEQIEPLIREDIPQCLRFITSGTKKMASLLDGLVQISRIGTVEINSESLDMNKVVREILASMEHQIKISNITLTVDSLPRCMGDLHMLDHVFTNLISNAIKYLDPSKESEIRISGKVEDDRSIYCVADNGIGIAAEHQKKVFEIFHRLNPEDSVNGEGLGLTIVTRIIDRLEGRIWLESEPGKGSKFFISLPAVKA